MCAVLVCVFFAPTEYILWYHTAAQRLRRLYRMHTETGSTGRMFFLCVVSMCLSFYTGVLFSTWVRDQEDQQQWSFCCRAVFCAVWPVFYCCFPANFQQNYTYNNYRYTGICVLWKFAEKVALVDRYLQALCGHDTKCRF